MPAVASSPTLFLAAALSAWTGHGAPPARAATAALSYSDLVRRLTDLEALAVLPDPGERSAEFTSRDRASRYDTATDRYLDWAANNDGTGFLGDNGDGGKIMARMDGPGCIWRIWTARADIGHVKIFLDGSNTPAVDIPFRSYFDGSQAPFTYRALAYDAAGGLNLWIPIPYKFSAKVVAYGSWGLYYHIGYSTFPPGTVVPTFSRDLPADAKAALAAADAALKPDAPPLPIPPGTTARSTVTVPAGGSAEIFNRQGRGAVVGLRLKVEGLDKRPRGEQWATLRELTLSISWDGESKPSVWAPLGDFFGVACGLAPQKSIPAGLDSSGWFYSLWHMPFSSGARITIGNDGASARTVIAEVTSADPARDPATLGRFHAKWNRNAFQTGRTDRKPDHTVLRAAGRGRFLGFMLHLYKSHDQVEAGSAPGDYWWGEGDEKFFVDGEKEPSWFGTGSEDYFGYAWATPDAFSRPWHYQSYNEGGIHNKGNRVLGRFQIQDNVPFQTSFEAAMEKYYKDDANVAYGVMPFWYQEPGTSDAYGPVSLAARTAWYESPGPRDPARWEGEDMARLSASKGSLVTQDMAGFQGTWSSGKHLLWFKNNLSDIGVGATGSWSFETGGAGSAELRAAFTRAPDFGIFQFRIDGKTCGNPVDLYAASVGNTGEIKLCDATLAAGRHEMTATVTGKNSASGAYYMGLDYLRLPGIPSALPRAPYIRASSIRVEGFDGRGRMRMTGDRPAIRLFRKGRQ